MLCLLAMNTAFAQTTKRTMTVVGKDGTEVKYRVNDVERVKFSETTYDLNNQWANSNETNAVGTVNMLDEGDVYTFFVYTSTEVTAASENDYDLKISLPKSLMGQNIDLAVDDNENVVVADAEKKSYGKGTLCVKFDKFQKNVTISLDAENQADDLLCEYSGVFGKTYEAANTMSVKTTKSETATEWAAASAFVVKPANVGDATNFAFGDAEAAEPLGLLGGKVGVWLSVSASKLNGGTIDMANDADSYTFRYIDYTTHNVYDKVASGTITTAEGYDGREYVSVNATLDDGTVVSVSYYGNPTVTESLDAMIPSAVEENEYKYYNADGNLSLTRELGTSYVDDYKGNLTFYLIPDGDTKYSSDKVVIKVESGFVNAGEISLAEVDNEKVFDIKYTAGGMQLQSYAAGYGYGNIPNNGTMTITKDDNGVYDIQLDVTNSYHNNYTEKGGDGTRLVVHYKGTFEAY